MAPRAKAKVQPEPAKPKAARPKAVPAAPPPKAPGSAAGRVAVRVAIPDAVRQKVCEALVEGCTRKAACGFAGISEAVLAEWLDTFPDFLEAVTCAENEAEKKFAAVILAAAQEGNWKAAAWWLERRRKDDYSARREVQHGGGIGVAKTAVEFDDDELATIAAGSGPGTDKAP